MEREMKPEKKPLEGECSRKQEDNDESQEAGVMDGEASCSQTGGTRQDEPEEDPKKYIHDPTGIWRALRKAKRLRGSKEVDLHEMFSAWDKSGTGKITPQLFIALLRGPIGYRIALRTVDIEKIAYFFEDNNTNKVDYRSFIDFIEDPEIPSCCIIPPETEGRQLEPLLQTTSEDPAEQDAVSMIVDYIAGVLMYNNVQIETIAVDDEQFKGKEITHAKLKKILARLGIYLEEADFIMLCRYYGRNVIQFDWSELLSEIRRTMIKLVKRGKYNPVMIKESIGKTFKKNFPKQVRPDFRQSDMRELLQNCDSLHNSQVPQRWLEMSEDTIQVIRRIQKTFYVHNVIAKPHFKQFDPHHTGRITVSQFLRALDECCINIGGRAKMFITPKELQNVIYLYTETTNPGLVVWTVFVSDIESSKCIRDLHRHPTANIRDHRPTGLREAINELPCKYARRYLMTAEEHRRTERLMEYIKNQLTECNVYHYFRAFDKTNRLHLTRCQLREVLSQLCITLRPQEFYDLEMYFLDIHGFCYMLFLWALGKVNPPSEIAPIPALRKVQRGKPKEGKYRPYATEATTGEEVFKKIRTTVFERGLRLKYFMEQYDRRNIGIMDDETFVRAINSSHNWMFTDLEFKKLIELFRRPLTQDSVDYRMFLTALDEMHTQPHLDQSPLVNPLPYLGTKYIYEFKTREWLMFGKVIDKLAKLGISLHSMHAFKNIVTTLNKHTVTYHQYVRALETLDVLRCLTPNELKLIFDVYKRPLCRRYEFDYIRFLETCHNASLSPKNTC